MSDGVYESEILKSLEALDEILSKSDGHIESLQPGSHRPVGPKWEGGDPEEEDDEDHIAENGTNYVPSGGKKKRKKMSKAFEEEEEEDRIDEDEDGDEEEEEEDKVSMSKGVEVSQFLHELTKSVAIYCYELEGLITKSLNQIHEENGAMSKAIAENLVSLNDIICKSQDNINEYAEGPARGPKSMLDMSKSISGSQEPELSKSVVIGALMKGVEAGTVSPLEIIKVEQFGVQAINQDVVKSLLA
jgi:hypothetical protein